MKRIVSETRVSDKRVRYRTRIEDDPSPRASWEARIRLIKLFDDIVHAPDLVNCGLTIPEKISITHSGEGWVLEAEATAEEE